MAYVIKLGGLWRSFVTFVVISIMMSFGILSSATSEQLLDIEIGELGYGRVTNGSLGEYNFLRVNCLKRVFPNFLNQTTVLPSLQATIRTDCPSDDGIGVDYHLFFLKYSSLLNLQHLNHLAEINSQSSVYLSRTDVSQFVTAISSSKSRGSFTVEMLFKPNVTGNPQYSEIFSLTRLSTEETCFSVSLTAMLITIKMI